MIRRQAAAGCLGMRCGCSWNSIESQLFWFFSPSYVSRSEHVPALHSLHCKVWQLSCSSSFSAIQAETWHFTVQQLRHKDIVSSSSAVGAADGQRKKSCDDNTSPLLQELQELFCHLLQATDRIFNQKTLLICYA